MDFLGTWRTRDGRIAVVEGTTKPFGLFHKGIVDSDVEVSWFSHNGNYWPNGDHPLDLMERISDRWGAKEGE